MRELSRLTFCIFWGLGCALPLFAAPRRVALARPDAAFSGPRAFDDLKRLVAFGPRPAGSKPLSDSRRWIVRQLEQMGFKVEEDIFQGATPFGGINMINLRVIIPGESPKVVMVAGHYDTKRFEEDRKSV